MNIYESLGVEKKNYSLLTTVYFSYWVSGMIATVTGAVLPFLKESYNLNYWFLGNLTSFHQIGNLISALLAGILPFAIGRKKTFVIFYTCFIIGLFFIASMGMKIVLLLAYLVSGFGRGGVANATNLVVMNTTKNKTGGLCILHASFAIGAFVAPVVLSVVSGLVPDFGWKVALWILCAIMSFILIFVAKADLPNKKEERKSKKADAAESGENAESKKLKPWYKAFSYWIVVFILLFYLCEESGTMGWLVTYFKDSGMLDSRLAGLATSILWLTIMIGRLICAAISGKMNKNLMVLVMGILNAVCFVLMLIAKSPVLIVASILLTGLMMSGLYPTTLSTMKAEYNSSPLSVGVCISVSILGGILMPMIIGIVAQLKTNSAVASGMAKDAAQKIGVTAGISTIAVALVIMVILMAIKLIVERNEEN